MESLHAMRLFLRTVQEGSFSAAGRSVGLSAASVSRQIDALEDHLGVQLLNRSSRRLSLTEAGAAFHQRLGHILSDLQEATESVSHFQQRPRGTLRVHAPNTMGILLIAPALPQLLRLYPELRVDLSLSNSPAIDLVERAIDVDVRVGRLEDSSLIARRLAGSESVVCASPSYLAQHPAPRTPADLARHNCLAYYVAPGQAVWRFLDRDGQLSEVKISGSLQTDNGAVILNAAVQGLGLAVLPAWAVAAELAAGRLTCVMADYRAAVTTFDSGIYAVYRRARHGSPKVKAFVEFLASIVAPAAGEAGHELR